MIEPRTDKINMDQFNNLRADSIDPIIRDFKSQEIIENSDSTLKKLIYQVPFS